MLELLFATLVDIDFSFCLNISTLMIISISFGIVWSIAAFEISKYNSDLKIQRASMEVIDSKDPHITLDDVKSSFTEDLLSSALGSRNVSLETKFMMMQYANDVRILKIVEDTKISNWVAEWSNLASPHNGYEEWK